MAEEETYKEPFTDLICADLKLDPCQWEDRSSCLSTQGDPRTLEVDSLIHDDWLSSAQAGVCTQAHRPTLSTEEVHWLLQPSCDSAPPTPWQRVHITCLRKNGCSKSHRRLVPQGNSYSLESIHEFLSQVSHENHLVSWRETLASLQDTLPSPPSHHSHPTNTLVRQIIKQLYHIEVQCIDQATSQSQPNNENQNQTVHANLIPMLAALESRSAFYLIFPYTRFTLFDAALHSPAMFDDSVAKTLFVLFQLLKLLSHIHSLGVTLGEVSLGSLYVDTRLWVQLRPHPLRMVGAPFKEGRDPQKKVPSEADNRVTLSPTPPALGTQTAPSLTGSTLTLTGDHTPSWAQSYTLPTLTLSEAVSAWRVGKLSNFDYLMLLNHHAGRVIGDPNNHPIFPWIIDFTSLGAGFRDLSRSKHFLTKGEDQLDFTYLSAQEEMRRAPDQDPLVPHHIGDISSDVTYYVYLARRTPKEVLCSHVRPRWVPEEYPVSMEKMYIWSPDECIPDFFIDPTIFKSIHPDLPDLQLPTWAGSPAEFIRLHRSILEGDAVSAQLHHWLDLVFGYKLTGHDAVKAKNVYLSVVDKHKNPTNSGIVQLFKSSHPKRAVCSSAPFVFEEWSSYLHKSSVSNVASFSIEHSSPLKPKLNNGSREEHKTLESILNQESAKKRARPEKDPDSSLFVGQENQEEEFYGSFEHVNLPELPSKPTGLPSTNSDPGVKDLPEKVMTGSKVKSDRNSVVLPGNQPRFRLPVVNRIIRPRRSQLEEETEYEWQVGEVSLPKEAHLLDRLTRLEELSHFVSKSCKDEGDLFPPAESGRSQNDKLVDASPATRVQAALERMRVDPSHYPSFEERMGIDVTAVLCTVIELCCMRQLRAAIPINATLTQRVGTIKKVLKSGQLKLPSFLLGLVDFVLSPDTPTSTPVTHLPNITASLILQPFLPIVSFPPYFDPLFKFIHNLEPLVRQASLGQVTFNLQKPQLSPTEPAHLPPHTQKQIDRLVEFISADIDNLLGVVSNEGFPLLLLHLFPFFTHPRTSFDAVFSFLEPLAQRMGRRNVERLFSLPLISLFDTAALPHQQAQLLCRTTAHMLIWRFGLGVFLVRFLGFYLEAVLEPFRTTTSKSKPVKRVNAHIMRLPSQNGDMSQAFESGRGRKTDLSFSLALSDIHHGYDLDKESSDEESDDDLLPEASLLAKTPMLSGISEVEATLTPLILSTDHTGSPGPGSPAKPGSQGSISPKKPHTDHTPTQSLSKTHMDHALTQSQSCDGDDSGVTGLSGGDKEDSRSNSPSPLYDTSLTMSVVSETIDSYDGFRDVRSESFGGHSSPGEGLREEPVLYESEEEEEEGGEAGETMTVSDPVTLAVNAQIAEVAADCLCWLMRRLGPLLSTQHIIRPLLDGLHRCFSGILHTSERQAPVLKCLSFFAETFGEDTINKLLIPKAEGMVSAATTRMSVKNEAGVAASLALVRIAIKHLLHTSLQNVAKGLCESYFVPLIQLLSSHTTFPSGGEGRAAICRSMIDLMIALGERLGREEASLVLIPTLELFFLCFDSVHSNEEETQLWSAGGTSTKGVDVLSNKGHLPDKSERVKADDLFDQSMTPTNSSPVISNAHDNSSQSRVVSTATPVNVHPLTPAKSNGDSAPQSVAEKSFSSGSFQQLCATFTRAMAHSAYIPFCRLLGQVNLNSRLRNTDLVEYIAYKHDDEVKTADVVLPRALADVPEEDSEQSSPPLSDSEDDPQHDAMLRVGPVSAVTGLGKDEAGFSRTVWFVDLEENTGSSEAPLDKPAMIHSSDSQPAKLDTLGYREALFDTKFSGVSVATSFLETPLSTALGKGVAAVAAVAGVAGMSTPAATTVVIRREENNMELKGEWSRLWERQLQRSVHNRDGFKHFRNMKLQTFSGHRGVVRAMAVSDSEHMFVSGSRDKSARVWRLGNHGDGDGCTSPSLTYSNHTKAVWGVELLEGVGQVVSCDGTVHLWDLETGYCLHQLQPAHNVQFTALRALSASQPTIAIATTDFQLRFYDHRTHSSLHSWKLQFPTGGTIRCLACAENWVAVGNSNGNINTLDIRTGELLTSWKPSDFYPNPATSWSDSLYQLRPTRRGNLVASVGQGLLSLWRPTYGKLLHPLKCPAHPVHCMEVCGDQLITVSSSGHLVVHDRFETAGEINPISMKVRHKGISSLSILPENRLLLLGTDIGHITLMA